MVRMSESRGALVSVSGSSASSAAGISARQAFLAPEIGMAPFSRWPPRTRMLSMLALLPAAARRSAAASRAPASAPCAGRGSRAAPRPGGPDFSLAFAGLLRLGRDGPIAHGASLAQGGTTVQIAACARPARARSQAGRSFGVQAAGRTPSALPRCDGAAGNVPLRVALLPAALPGMSRFVLRPVPCGGAGKCPASCCAPPCGAAGMSRFVLRPTLRRCRECPASCCASCHCGAAGNVPLRVAPCHVGRDAAFVEPMRARRSGRGSRPSAAFATALRPI